MIKKTKKYWANIYLDGELINKEFVVYGTGYADQKEAYKILNNKFGESGFKFVYRGYEKANDHKFLEDTYQLGTEADVKKKQIELINNLTIDKLITKLGF